MRLYECIIDDDESVYKCLATGNDKQDMLNVYGLNGRFVEIKDITNDFFSYESIEKLDDDLSAMGWNKYERKLICALLRQHLNSLL